MLQVALYQPEIPPNTGNIIRLCANTGHQLHLIHPLGFTWDDKKLRRAGLDYHEFTAIQHHDDYAAFLKAVAPNRVFACTTKAQQLYTEPQYRAGDVLLLGPETRGLPVDLMADLGPGQCIKIPMHPQSRSLNLSNAAAVILYEAWRQCDFA